MTPSSTLPECLTAAAARRRERTARGILEARTGRHWPAVRDMAPDERRAFGGLARALIKAKSEIDLDARRREIWRDMQ